MTPGQHLARLRDLHNPGEVRRRHTVALLEAGWSISRVAREVGVSRQAVQQWLKGEPCSNGSVTDATAPTQAP